jgi:hypothetical protein
MDKLSKDQIDEFVKLAGQNPDSRIAVLGPWTNDLGSYEQVGYRIESSYFDMGDAYMALGEIIPDAPLKINMAWLRKQIAENKEFVLTVDPNTVTKTSKSLLEELEILKVAGYKLPTMMSADGLWHLKK